MTEPKKITRDEADIIILEWRKKHQPYEMKAATACYNGQWYDVRGMTNDELVEFGTKLMGRKPKTVGVNI